jgi:hypothetical protein
MRSDRSTHVGKQIPGGFAPSPPNIAGTITSTSSQLGVLVEPPLGCHRARRRYGKAGTCPSARCRHFILEHLAQLRNTFAVQEL